ncbi:MAG: alpha/beta hydrolase, partial [Rhodospirillaceae bacterium]|nr:alpha/beta hydrolase [Rhodospirillaceae bacterium]
MTTLEFFADGPESATRTVLLAHGAGQAMDSPFMTNFAAALAQASADTRVLRFEFPYMRDMRASGNRRAPDREAKLLECWREVVASECGAGALYIGGKSMGGRMASLVADELGV